jgi:Mg2+ and Co2+ transporter CorA
MNVGLPGGGDPGSSAHTVFWIIIAAMIVLIAGMLAFFRRRGWF